MVIGSMMQSEVPRFPFNNFFSFPERQVRTQGAVLLTIDPRHDGVPGGSDTTGHPTPRHSSCF